jgi:ATP-dependent helicase/nuclease subunit A
MLAVTFTKAAAAKLRGDIRAALRELYAAEPGAHLYVLRALRELPSALIGTIDSFCLGIVRENFANPVLSLSPTFSVIDGERDAQIKQKYMNKILDRLYSARSKRATVEGLIEICSGENGEDGTAGVLIALYNKLLALPDGILPLKTGGEDDEAQTRALITQIIAEDIEHFAANYAEILKVFRADGRLGAPYAEQFIAESEWLESVQSALAAGIDTSAIDGLLSRDFDKFISINPRANSKKPAEYPEEWAARAKRTRDELKKYLKEDTLLRRLSMPRAAVERAARESAEYTALIYEILEKFHGELTAEYRRIGAFSFSEIENLALRLLSENPETASGIARRFDYIYIDEYQDTNAVQDRIFRLISRGNRFMVGDAKQSIYSFRAARPDLFLGYKEAFAGQGGEGTLAVMRGNYRCSRNIIDYANELCGVLFENSGFRKHYTEDDRLECKKKAPDGPSVETRFFDAVSAQSELDYIVNAVETSYKEDLSRAAGGPRTIAVSTRSAKRLPELKKRLEALGIPISAAGKGELAEFFALPEISLSRSLLSAASNPTDEINLAACLMSPCFGFTPGELLSLRRTAGAEAMPSNLYYQLQNTESGGGNSARRDAALGWLVASRDFSRNNNSYESLRYILEKSSFLSLLRAEAEPGAYKNVMRLCEYARAFVGRQNGAAGAAIHDLLRYFDELSRSEDALKDDSAKDGGTLSQPQSCVTLSTIHRAKGLEFDTVFLYDTGGELLPHNGDKEKIAWHRDIGVSFSLPTGGGYARLVTPRRALASRLLDKDAIDEEIRLLYVALTRAKHRLVICGTLGHRGLLDKLRETLPFCITKRTLQSGKSYLKWIITCEKEALSKETDRPAGGDALNAPENVKTDSKFSADADTATLFAPVSNRDDAETARICALLHSRLDAEYPHALATLLPMKMSVSHLHPGVLDDIEGDAEDIHELIAENAEGAKARESRTILPSFMLPEQPASAALRGTATHSFMQFCDMTLAPRNFQSEAERLAERRYIPAEYLGLIDYGALQTFFDSPIFADMRRARRVEREVRFNVKLPAADFTTDETKKAALTGSFVFVQGVIDCYYEDAEGVLRLIDYKTDHFGREDIASGAAERTLIEHHRGQLSYYRRAIEIITGRDVGSTAIYSFGLGRAVYVN